MSLDFCFFHTQQFLGGYNLHSSHCHQVRQPRITGPTKKSTSLCSTKESYGSWVLLHSDEREIAVEISFKGKCFGTLLWVEFEMLVLGQLWVGQGYICVGV